MVRFKITLFFFILSFFTLSQSLPEGVYARFSTSKGKILLYLEVEKAPMTSANFIALSEGKSTILGKEFNQSFYHGVKFHRVIKDFMIQGGDPQGTGEGGPGYKFYDEFHPDLKHIGPGILSMANSGPNTNGSQFFITHVKTPWLDNKHSVFGHVVEGQNVVDAIQQNDVIDSITILRIGKKYKKYNPSIIFNKYYSIIDKKKSILINQQEKAKSISQDNYKEYFFAEVKKKIKNNQSKSIGFKISTCFKQTKIKQTPSGLVYVIQNYGDTAKVQKGNIISLHYTGKLFNDEKFDSSLDRNQSFDTKYKEQGIISGFEEGLSLVGKGGKITLFIPYYLGYGEKSVSIIPSYSDLIFDLEILDIK
jgi:cyclophilin family peptidyl-prolyl cis-trans isomerase